MRDLAVVTSCTGYGKYLPDWARAIAAQTSKPAEVAILMHGDADDVADVHAAGAIIRAAGIPFALESYPERLDFGLARNLAVGMTSAPWVLHMDADDTLFPYALADAAQLADTADVIAFGYERTGDLASGPNNRRRTYRALDGLQALESSAPCSSNSPFRRSLWAASPYRLGMRGAWDTGLWIGFARLGARFRPVTRPAFAYRQHAGSIFNRRRKTFDFTHAHVAKELGALRRGDEGVTVVIPYRADGGARDRSLAHVCAHYKAMHPDWQVRVGSCAPAGAWRKGQAVNDALTAATGAVLIIADGDCVVDPATLRACVQRVEDGAPWAIPHDKVYRLSEPATLSLMERGPTSHALWTEHPRSNLIRAPYRGYDGGGIVVVRRDRYEATGGMPVDFAGWGCEDESLAVILTTLLGPPDRLAAPLVHLWHPPGERRRDPLYQLNRRRLETFRAAQGDEDAMWRLVDPSRPLLNEPKPRRYGRPVGILPPTSESPHAIRRAQTMQQAGRPPQRRLNEVALAKAREMRLLNDELIRQSRAVRGRGV